LEALLEDKIAVSQLANNHKKIDVSIIIPLYKSSEVIKDQIRSWHFEPDLKVEIVYVDDCCPENSKSSVIKTWNELLVKKDNVKLVMLMENRGFGGACNVGAHYAEGKNLIFLNADTKTTNGWITPIIELLEDKEVGMVGNMQIKEGENIDGTIDGCGSEWDWGEVNFRHIGRHVYKHEEIKKPIDFRFLPKDLLKVEEREMVTACCFGIRKELFEEIGGFDLNYKIAYWEDSEICLTVRELGYKILYQPNSRIYHKLSHTSKSKHPYHDYNKIYFVNKWLRSGRIDKFVGNPRPMALDKIESILVRRHSAHGDVLMAAAVAPALKKKFPDAKITFITTCKEVLKGNKYIDEIPDRENVLSKDYDLFYNLDLAYERRPKTNILKAYADVVGVSINDCELFIKQEAIDVPNKYIVIHPGRTAWLGRDWHEDRFNKIADRLRKLNYKVVCTGREKDRKVDGLDLRGKTSMSQLAYVIANARLFVGIDSLAMHIAQAVNMPAVCFFGAIEPRTRIVNPNVIPVTAPNLACLGCHHRQLPPAVGLEVCETKNLDCEKKVTVDHFMNQIEKVLDDF